MTSINGSIVVEWSPVRLIKKAQLKLLGYDFIEIIRHPEYPLWLRP